MRPHRLKSRTRLLPRTRLSLAFLLAVALLLTFVPGCEGPCPDFDGDGFFANEGCDGPPDCDDGNPAIFPGALEILDGIDTDCNASAPAAEADLDGDSFSPYEGDCDDADPSVYPQATETCDGQDSNCDGTPDGSDDDLDGTLSCQDCDDQNALTFPGAPEVCDGEDNNCNGKTDEGFDQDGDGVATCASSPSATLSDCNDQDPTIHPDAAETCDGIDNNCDGLIDNVDADQDGDRPIACGGTDCNDADSAIHPQAAESCNTTDDNCNGLIDEDLPASTWTLDLDGDSFGVDTTTQETCQWPGPGWVASSGDCNDGNSAIHPQAAESCDGLDNNCDGTIDEAFDHDQDGFTSCAGDCDDARADIAPGHTERCDSLDNNCNGSIDEGFDQDSDGSSTCMGDCNDTDASICPSKLETCDGIDNNCDGLIDNLDADQDGDRPIACGGTDCNDASPSTHTLAPELCNSRDDDCDSLIDGADPDAPDADGDGVSSCNNQDCDDTDPDVSPAQPESCDGIDQDCDGIPDNRDEDQDGVLDEACGGEDCDDELPTVNAYTTETCDGLDNNCDGIIDEDLDLDGDGFASCFDCNDADSAIHPGAAESCNATDDDCDGLIDDGIDEDGDGYQGCGSRGCPDCLADCQDQVAWVHPEAPEVCDGYDSDCSGSSDGPECDPKITSTSPSQPYRDNSTPVHFLITGGPFHPLGRVILERGFDNIEYEVLNSNTIELYATPRCDTPLGPLTLRYEHPGAGTADCTAATSPDFACFSLTLLEGFPKLERIEPDPIFVPGVTTLNIRLCNPDPQALIFVGARDICTVLQTSDALQTCSLTATLDSSLDPTDYEWQETLIYVPDRLRSSAPDFDTALDLCPTSGVDCATVRYVR